MVAGLRAKTNKNKKVKKKKDSVPPEYVV